MNTGFEGLVEESSEEPHSKVSVKQAVPKQKKIETNLVQLIKELN